MPNLFEQGHFEMLQALGLTKTAAPIIYKAPFLRRAGWWLGKKLPQWGKALKETAIGEPRKFLRELEQGKAFSKGSLIRESYKAPGILNKVFWYGFPAYEGLEILRDQDPNKAERLGGLIGGTALGMGAFKPLGMLGYMGADWLGHRLGSGLARTAKHLAGPEVNPQGRWEYPIPEAPQYFQPPMYPPYA